MALLAAAAVASAAAGAYGAYTASKSAAAARKQNQQNIDIAKRQQQLSEEMQESSLAPTRDARGNVTRYIPGVGWVEEPTALTRALMLGSDAEEQRRLQEDLPRQRMQRENMFSQQQHERGLAGAMLARMGTGERTMQDIEADNIRVGAAQVNANTQQQNRDAVITALRQGTSADDVLASNGRNNASNLRLVLEQARAGTPSQYHNAESERLNDATQRYMSMVGHAYAPDTLPFAPNTLADTLATRTLSQQKTSPYALAHAMNLRPAQISPVDDQVATRIQSGINGIMGAYDWYNARTKQQQQAAQPAANSALYNYAMEQKQHYIDNPNAPVTNNTANYLDRNNAYYSADYAGSGGTVW
jgi:hypothetical protein